MTGTLREKLSESCSAALESMGFDGRYGEVVPCGNPRFGDFQCSGIMAAAKAVGTPPRDLATRVAAALAAAIPELLAECAVAGPGFVNMRVRDAVLAAEMVGSGLFPASDKRKVVVDYGGPNIAKPMHVGHLRSAIIGESIKRILRSRGHDVIGDVHLGDWGLPLGLVAAELELKDPSLPYFTGGEIPEKPPVTIDDLEDMYPRASARSKKEAAFLSRARELTAAIQAGDAQVRTLWKHFRAVSVASLRNDFERLGVVFDRWDGESSVADLCDDLCAACESKGLAVESEGALVIPISKPDDTHEIPPFLLRKSDGSVLYSTTDLAALIERAEEGADRIVYVVDSRQALHFESLFRAARRFGIHENILLEHAGFGTVNGPDGKPFKTRDGGVMRLSDLLEMATRKALSKLEEGGMAGGLSAEERMSVAEAVGLAAIKFADLSAHRQTSYVFDLDRFTSFEGRTGPYVQYMAVRLGSILEKARKAGLEPSTVSAPSNDAERALMLSLISFGDAVVRAERLLAPSEVALWAYETARVIGLFYNASPILHEADKSLACARLALAVAARSRLECALNLLGIDVPARM